MGKSDLIKRAYTESEYTTEQVMELKKCAKDPLYFMRNYMKVQHPTKGAVKFNLFDYQERCVKAFRENRWVIVKCGRQMGKTTVIAAYLLWFACFHFEKYILVASKDNDAAMDVMDRIRFGYEELPHWLKPGCVYNNRHEIVFDNNSAIKSTATTENTGRGRAVSLLMLDELAFVKSEIQDDMWASLAPTLSTGGSCIVSSTPNGDQDLYAQLWRGANTFAGNEPGENGFMPVNVEWDEHPDRTSKYKDEMIAKVGEEKWEQEYECKFLSSDPLLINSLVLQAMKGRQPLFIDKGFKFWQKIEPSRTYMVGCDVSEGIKKDFSTIEVFELETLRQVAEYRSNTVKEGPFYQAMKWVITYILGHRDPQSGKKAACIWSFENNSVGAAIAAMHYADEKFPEEAELVSHGAKIGMPTSHKSKSIASRDLKRLIERSTYPLEVYSEELINELKNYVQSGSKGTYHAKAGATDDLVAATLIITRLINYISTFEPDAFNKLYGSEDEFYQETTSEFDEPMPMSIM